MAFHMKPVNEEFHVLLTGVKDGSATWCTGHDIFVIVIIILMVVIINYING